MTDRIAVWIVVLLLVGCTKPPEDIKPAPSEDNLTPAQLTGIPTLDQPNRLELRVLYARGTGVLTGQDRPMAPNDPIPAGSWLVSTPGSEFELSFRSSLVTDGIVRLGPSARLLMERPPVGLAVEARFRLYSGQASFFLPPLPQNQIEIITPSGTLTSPGGAFTITISPDFQVLVTCREGLVFLTGTQNAAAWPGQVFQFGPAGNNIAWTLTPNQALTFQGRWLTILSEESPSVLLPQLPRRLSHLNLLRRHFQLDEAEKESLWWMAVRPYLGTDTNAPGVAEISDLWDRAARERRDRGGTFHAWDAPTRGEGLLGNHP